MISNELIVEESFNLLLPRNFCKVPLGNSATNVKGLKMLSSRPGLWPVCTMGGGQAEATVGTPVTCRVSVGDVGGWSW